MSKLARSQPSSVCLSSLSLGLQLHLQTRSITASKCISEFTQSRSPMASPNLLDHGCGVYRWVHSISLTSWIYKLARSPPRSAPLSSLDPGLEVHLWTCSITASKNIVRERWWLNGESGVAEEEWVTGSIYSGDPGVDRHHLIIISSCHTTKIHAVSFPTFGLTRSCRDFVDPFNCMDPHGWVVSYVVTFFQCFSS